MTNQSKNIHLSIQVVPLTQANQVYPIVDKAINLIQKSGFRYIVSPMETTIEGPFNELLSLVQEIHEITLQHADEILINVKIHSRKESDITFEEKGISI